jgi:hypothetical protein
MDKPIPMTYNRAATALVFCRSGLSKVRSEIELALRILRILDEEGRRGLGDLQIDRTALRDLEVIRDRLEDVRRVFEGTRTYSPEREPSATPTRSEVDPSDPVRL